MLREESLNILNKREKYRLNYHLMPAKGLLNDPNGLIQKNDTFYVFYQWNDKECSHGSKKWGLYTSKDLINWKIEGSVLEPKNTFDSHGCYSGSAILIDNKINLLYTGNVKNDKGERKSYQCLAIEKEDGAFEKIGPVINEIPNGYTEHYRDPKIWEENSVYYMIIGAQKNNLKGAVNLYKSNNVYNWEFVGELYSKGDLGYMIECPDIFPLNEKHVFLSSPQGLEAKGDLFQNIYQAGYIIGDLDLEKCEFKGGEFIELDRGFDFYATQSFLDSKGRRIIYAWMGLPEEEEGMPSIEEGNWVHALTIPRELILKGNKIIQKPLVEMEKLREDKIVYKNIFLKDSLSLEEIEGDSYELIVELESISASNFGVKLRKYQDEEVLIKFQNNRLIMDRNSTPYLNGIRACKVEGQNHKLHFFVDKSSIELFYNDGIETFTSRIYSSDFAKGIEFFSEDGEILIKKIEFFKLTTHSYFL